MRYVDWTRQLSGLTVENPSSRQYKVEPGATLSVFNGSRSTSIDGTTTFSVTLNPLSTSRYRVTASAGTSPAFRTPRALTLSGVAITITAVANGTLKLDLGAGVVAGDFAAIQAGDHIWIPGTTTGDSAGPFNSANEGLWSCLGVAPSGAVANRAITLKRINTEDPSGASETVTPASNDQIIAFSATGVQVGDTAEFASPLWTTALRRSFAVDRVTPTWFEFLSTNPLPLDVGVLPTSTGLIFYSDAKRYLRIEADQEAAVQLNGDTDQLNRISPISPADPQQVGWMEKFGPTWKLDIVNRSDATMSINVIACD